MAMKASRDKRRCQPALPRRRPAIAGRRLTEVRYPRPLGALYAASRHRRGTAASPLDDPAHPADAWADHSPQDFPNYAAGSDGPAPADELLARDGRAWRPLD